MSAIASDGFNLTPSDTVNVVDDVGNTKKYNYCFIHNKGLSGLMRVNTLKGTTLTIYVNQGDVLPLLVTRVFATSPTPPSPLIGLIDAL